MKAGPIITRRRNAKSGPRRADKISADGTSYYFNAESSPYMKQRCAARVPRVSHR